MEQNARVGRSMARGALGGLLWGIGMRAWMRFITFDPEFTWSGTLFIIGTTTLAGAMTGLAYHRWRLSQGNWWRLLGFFFVPLGMAAGSVMVPTFVLGGLALGRRTWPSWVRIGLAVVAIGFQLFFFLSQDAAFPDGRAALALPIYAIFLGIETWAFSIIARPLPQNAVPPADPQLQRVQQL
ncbi:MAG: hypothetical protein ACRDVK_11865 [Acidimicrobiia bacterium]